MFKELAKDFYEDEYGSFCAIAEKVKNPKKIAEETGLIKIIQGHETIVIINPNLVNIFKRIELKQRLNLNFDISNYNLPDSNIPEADGNYLIAAEPLSKDEIKGSGISKMIGSGRIAVRFQRFYRSNVAQNEINKWIKKSMEKLRDSYDSQLAREFYDYLID